jgi:hypothetical protein
LQRSEVAVRLGFSQAEQYRFLACVASNGLVGRLIAHCSCISRPSLWLEPRIFLHGCVRCVAKAHNLHGRSGEPVFEVFPPVVTNKGEGSR